MSREAHNGHLHDFTARRCTTQRRAFSFFVVRSPAVPGALLFSMNTGIDLKRPRAAACPDCGYPPDLVCGADLAAQQRQLPRMTPERLWFLTEEDKQVPAPKLACTMPNGDLVYAWCGVVYAMTDDEWMHYECMRRAA